MTSDEQEKYIRGTVIKVITGAVIVAILLSLGINHLLYHKSKTSTNSVLKEIKIKGEGVSVDVERFRVERDRAGNTKLPEHVAGTITAERDIKRGEEIPISVDLRGASSRASDLGYRALAGVDTRAGYYNALGQRLFNLGPVELGYGVGYGFGNSSLLALGYLGFNLISEHSLIVGGYTSNGSFTVGVGFKF